MNWSQQFFHRKIENIFCFNFIALNMLLWLLRKIIRTRVVYYLLLVEEQKIVYHFTPLIFKTIVMIYLCIWGVKVINTYKGILNCQLELLHEAPNNLRLVSFWKEL